MRIVNITEAKAKLSRLVDQALAGEEVVIARAGRPLVRLSVVQADDRPRDLSHGYWAGRIAIADDFDAPLPDDVLDAVEGRAA
ncbi:MAG: type II toxin-antitoxin system prevent-host-death family antitoxin [Trueperaceae bacterium]|nr:type II toxin-antitoxin system prevent-host-death family antitoxin [Trueperaceae bacterium]